MDAARDRRNSAGGQPGHFLLKGLSPCLHAHRPHRATVLAGVPELRIIGRIAFPLYAWCLVVGSEKTRSPLRYGLRLLLLGVVSQPLYMMALAHSWQDLNILFSLLIGLAAIVGIQKRWMLSQLWAPALCYVLLGFVRVDYGWMGLTFILVLYGARQNRPGLIAAYLAYALFWGAGSGAVRQLFGWPLTFLDWPGLGTALSSLFRVQGMVWLSLPLIALPTHTRLKMPQWLGYARTGPPGGDHRPAGADAGIAWDQLLIGF